jgi:hypothetical protein
MTQPLLQRSLQRDTRLTPRSRADTGRVEGGAGERGMPWATAFVRGLAAQDWLIFGYFALLLFALAIGTGPGRPASIERVTVDLLGFVVGIVLTRGGIVPHGSFANGLLYRLTVFLSVFFSYFLLRDILPAVSSRALDAEILAFDLRVFHVEPSLAWDRFVNPTTTEWFAFFYFSYFSLLAIHIFPMMLAARDMDLLARFSLGIFMVFCTGHCVYMLVPGYGPYRHMAGQFEHTLSGGLFWRLVREAVDAGGAQKDIFPSLHTALPTYFALFALKNRAVWPFKVTFWIVAFFASQIICATMFLRWHYLIDICAGIVLATTAVVVPAVVIPWERKRRVELGVPPTFTNLFGARPPSAPATTPEVH